MPIGPRRIEGWAVCAILSLCASPALAAAAPDESLLRTYCGGCHSEQPPGHFARISAVRKSPEGWVMTLFRMRHTHGLALPDEVNAAVLHYLADTQGLAPNESAPGRFALERRPNAKDLDFGPELAAMCGRCHSLARVALERRGADEWLKHVHFHLGQWPSLEYQDHARDRPWWQIATQQLPAQLAGLFPEESAVWTEWKSRPARDLSGRWVVVGHVAGGRDFYGSAEIRREADGYTASYALTDTAGTALAGHSHALVYTGYEWRGRAELEGRATREVYAASEDGNRISGRWFDADHDEEGGEWAAIRADAPAQLLAVLPRALKAGSEAAVTIVGTGLGGSEMPSFGAGTRATVARREANVLAAQVKVAADAAPGNRAVAVGAAVGALAVYRQVDEVEVEPGYGIARLGGGKTPGVSAQFEAVGYAKSPGGERIPLGVLKATWSTLPYDDQAKYTHDDIFAGHIEANGRFVPAGAGPNPAREFAGNNVGNLAVVAHIKDGERELEGRSHLIVTVQRWNTPPIY